MAMDLNSIPVLSDLIRILIGYSSNIVYMLITFALGWIIGHIVGFIIRSIIEKMGLEVSFRRTSIGRTILRSGYTPGSFFAAIGKGIIYLSAFLSALIILGVPQLTTLIRAFIDYLPNLIVGVLILVFGFTFIDWIGGSIEKGGSPTVQSSLLSWTVKLLLYFTTITIALAQMKIDVTILYIFAQAFAWSLAIAIGIAIGWNLKDKVGLWFGKMMPEEKGDEAT